MSLNRNGVLPLYYQIKQYILDKIDSGEWQVGEKIPSGPALSDQLKVSVMTVRQAISELVDEGMLVSKRGVGTFVARPKLAIKLPYFMSYTDEMKLRGFKPATRLVEKGLTRATIEVAMALNISVGSEVYYCERLRLADDEPMCFEISYFSPIRFPDFPFPKKQYESFYRIFEDKYGVEVVRAEQVLQAVKATKKQSQMLKIDLESPVFFFMSREFDGSGEPVAFTEGTYRGDRYSLTVERVKRY